jgi:hypothetical protein
MTIGEYKAWVDGFLEGVGKKTPTKEQWEKIQKKLQDVHEPPTTVIRESYPYYVPYRDRLVGVEQQRAASERTEQERLIRELRPCRVLLWKVVKWNQTPAWQMDYGVLNDLLFEAEEVLHEYRGGFQGKVGG